MSSKSVGNKSVLTALFVNLFIAILKFGVWFFTGGIITTLFAEGIHSLVDTGNQAMIYFGIKYSEKPADDTFQYSYKRGKYIWTYTGMFVLFLAGGVYGIYEGTHSLFYPEHGATVSFIAMGVFGLGALLEGWSLRTATIELKEEAGNKKLASYIRKEGDPTLVAIFLEDSAAVVGNIIGLIAMILVLTTGNHAFDSMATLIIGLMLAGVSFVGLKKSFEYLLGKAVTDEDRSTITNLIYEENKIFNIDDFKSEILSSDSWELSIRIGLNEEKIKEELYQSLLSTNPGLDEGNYSLKEAIDLIAITTLKKKDDFRKYLEDKIRKEFPQIKHLDTEFYVANPDSDETALLS